MAADLVVMTVFLAGSQAAYEHGQLLCRNVGCIAAGVFAVGLLEVTQRDSNVGSGS